MTDEMRIRRPDDLADDYADLLAYMHEHGGYGDLPPITVDESGQIIDGIRRAQAAKAYGLATCPSYVVKEVTTNAQRMTLRRSLNKDRPLAWADEASAWGRPPGDAHDHLLIDGQKPWWR